jgi:hypothetical protein
VPRRRCRRVWAQTEKARAEKIKLTGNWRLTEALLADLAVRN